MSNRWFFLPLITLVVALVLVLGISTRGVPVVRQTNLEKLPLDIAGFRGIEDSFSPAVYAVLNADMHLYRHYRSPDGRNMDLYIGYYGTAKGGRTGHNPYGCLPGAGWAIIEQGTVEVRPSYYPQGTRVNYVVAHKDGINNVLLHWYQSARTQVLASGLQQNIHRFMGRVLQNRNDGAYVQISTFTDEEGTSETKASVVAFALAALEIIPAHWPVEE